MKHKRNPYVVPTMSAEEVRALQELRRSGAAGAHLDRRKRRQRTRAALRRAALREW